MNKAEVFLYAGVLPLVLAGLIVSHADPHARGVADLCSVAIRNPYLRSERETYFLGSARSDTVQVRISDVPGVLRPRRYPYRDSTSASGGRATATRARVPWICPPGSPPGTLAGA